jgi:Tfp pilus assembly protein PilF
VLAHQGRYQESYSTFVQVVGKAAAHANVGAIMAKKGETQEAMRQLSHALAMNPKLKQPQALLSYLETRTQPDKTTDVIRASHFDSPQ